MNKDTIIIIAVAAAGLWLIARTVKNGGLGNSNPAPTATGAARTSAIMSSGASISTTDVYDPYGMINGFV